MQVRRFETFRGFRAPFLGFSAILLSLLAAPSPVVAFGQSGSYVPLVSLFLEGIKDGALPPGWHFVVYGSGEPLEIYVVASIVLALLLSSPLISYQVMKVIVSVRRTRYLLTASASLLFASGAVFGLIFFVGYVLEVLTPSYPGVVISPPIINAASFYMIVFGAISATAVVFSLPLYFFALMRLRR